MTDNFPKSAPGGASNAGPLPSPSCSPSAHRPGLFGRFLQVLGAVVLLCVILIPVAGVGLAWWALRDTRRPSAKAVEVRIERGDSLPTIARRLEAARVAGPAPMTVLLAVAQGRRRVLRAGQYRLVPGTPPTEVLAALVRGAPDDTIRVTLPEGWTAAQMAERLAAAGAIADAQRFLSLCREADFLTTLGLNGGDAEGFLFPDTYTFRPATDEAAVIRRLSGRLHEVVWALGLRPGINSPDAQPLTYREFITLASLIEREAGDPDEMPVISSVFHNRLRAGMRLESCASIRHALGRWTAPLTLDDLAVDSPYNTYRRAGLPPGPICNPGRRAIEAAFRPARTDYLYFVYRGEHRHEFSRTLKEHLAARKRYKDSWAMSALPGPTDDAQNPGN